MRINHNITSLNTYRQLSTNTTAQGKSIEKLSSGLRINRAGDDAAGLAISEKMRGQIRGLDMAARNSQDAISLVQTAEGALNETHSILQRMKELATQASNGTYTDDDRNEIQNEINQLTSEINRIGNTTEFNTKKLLNGDVGVGAGQNLKTGAGAPVYTGTSLSNVSLDANATIVAGKYEAKIENLGGQVSKDVGANQAVNGATNGTVSGTDTALNAGSYKVVVTSENAVNTSAVVTAKGIASSKDLTVAANSTLLDDDYKIEIGKTTTNSVTAVSTAGLSDLKLDGTSTPADGVYSITTSAAVVATDNGGDSLKSSGVISGISIAAGSNYADGDAYKIELTNTGNDEYTIKLINSGGDQASTKFTVSAAGGVNKVTVGDVSMDIDFTQLYNSSTHSATDSTFAGDIIDLAIKDTVTITNLTDPTKTATADVTGGKSDQSFALANGGGTFTLDAAGITRGQTVNVTVSTNVEYTAELKKSDGTSVAGSTKQTLTQADLATPSAYKNLSLGNGVTVNLDAATLTATTDGTWNTTFTTEDKASLTAELQDAGGVAQTTKFTLDTSGGAKTLDLGTTGATFNYSDTTTAGDFVFTVDSNTTADDFRLTLTQTHDASGNATGTVLKNQVAVDPNATIDLGDGASVKTAVAMAHGDKATFQVEAGTVDKSLNMQVGANQGQTFTMNVSDMRSDALGISTKNGSEVIKDADGTTTIAGASWTTTKAATKGTDNVAEEYALKVTDTTSASAAIKVLENAINTVSAERSKLGAYQNRLDHTINNLNTSSENLTAAESRVRDVDMAKEMMEQTKNSILAQAAQAMLAQANQQPQGVLQLLR